MLQISVQFVENCNILQLCTYFESTKPKFTNRAADPKFGSRAMDFEWRDPTRATF